jgi:hypothetical protein
MRRIGAWSELGDVTIGLAVLGIASLGGTGELVLFCPLLILGLAGLASRAARHGPANETGATVVRVPQRRSRSRRGEPQAGRPAESGPLQPGAAAGAAARRRIGPDGLHVATSLAGGASGGLTRNIGVAQARRHGRST